MKDLKEKITKVEDMPDLPLYKQFKDLSLHSIGAPWWLQREWLRIESRVYPVPTAVLNDIGNQSPQFALHTSLEDPAMVAYTPDKAYGESDRQVKTSLGKFLVKYYGHLPDPTIASLVADHLGELSTEFELITGPAIQEAYKTVPLSFNCCMAYAESKYAFGNPTIAYDAPNIGLAVLRNANGDITAKCMLYTPSATDKRYIRFYGDKKLEVKLKRLGYVVGSWEGAQFKTIEIPKDVLAKFDPLKTLAEGVKGYVVPYLDQRNMAANLNNSSVAIIDGVLTCVSLKIAAKLSKLYRGQGALACASNTSGIMYLYNYELSKYNTVCPISGKSILWSDEVTYKYYDGEKVVGVHKDVTTEGACGIAYYKASVDAAKELVSLREGTPIFSVVDSYKTVSFVDNPEVRTALGYVKLDTNYYPEEQDWYLAGGRTERVRVTPEKTFIKLDDAVMVYSNKEWLNEHSSVIDRTYTKLKKTKMCPAFAAPGEPIIRTISGAKVVEDPHVYDIRLLYDGTWDFTRNTLTANLFGERIIYSSKGTSPDVAKWSSLWQERFEEYVTEAGSGDLDSGCCKYVSRYISSNLHVSKDYTMINMPSRFWRMGHFRPFMVETCGISVDLLKVYNWLERKKAEMEAIDYNLPESVTPDYTYHLLVPSPEELREQELVREKVGEIAALARFNAERAVTLQAALDSVAATTQFLGSSAIV